MADDIVRQYTVLPAVEQTKIMIINKLNLLFDTINVLLQNRLSGVKDDDTLSLIKSTTLTLYIVLKPKIMEHIYQQESLMSEKNKRTDQRILALRSLFNMDTYILNPNQFDVQKALGYADIINLFCHEYGITKITYFSGASKAPEGDIGTIQIGGNK